MTMRAPSWLYVAVALAGASALCTVMLATRISRTEDLSYGFMPWNLTLAWLPLVFAIGARVSLRWHAHAGAAPAFACGVLWLLFFPNAPYVVTDAAHFRLSANVPFWYDAIMLAGFISTGFSLGLLSLYLLQDMVSRAAGVVVGWTFALVSIGLCGLGVYLGRVLRWNSWDAMASPQLLLSDVAALVRHPIAHQDAWGLIILFAGFLASYLVFFATARLGLDLQGRDHVRGGDPSLVVE